MCGGEGFTKEKSIFTKVHIVDINGIFGTKKVESFCYSWNILQRSKKDLKNNKSTNGDYYEKLQRN